MAWEDVRLEAVRKAAWEAAKESVQRVEWETAWKTRWQAAEEATWGDAWEVVWEAAWKAAWKAAWEAIWKAAEEAAWEAAWKAAWKVASEVTWEVTWKVTWEVTRRAEREVTRRAEREVTRRAAAWKAAWEAASKVTWEVTWEVTRRAGGKIAWEAIWIAAWEAAWEVVWKGTLKRPTLLPRQEAILIAAWEAARRAARRVAENVNVEDSMMLIGKAAEKPIREAEYKAREEAELRCDSESVCFDVSMIWFGKSINFSQDEIDRIVEEAFNGLPEGCILFNYKDKMKVGVLEDVQAYIAKNLLQVQEQVASYCLNTKTDTVKISKKMKVLLTGNNFEIKALNDSEQSIMNGRVATWRWSVKPLESGIQRLSLIAYAIIEIPSDRTVEVLARTENIVVEVNPMYSLGRHLNTILAVIGIIVTLTVGIFTVILTK